MIIEERTEKWFVPHFENCNNIFQKYKEVHSVERKSGVPVGYGI